MNICITITKSFKITIHVFSWRIARSENSIQGQSILTHKVTTTSSSIRSRFIPPPPPPVLFEIVQEALLLPPRVKLKMLLHRWRGGGAGIEIEGSAKTLKERPRC